MTTQNYLQQDIGLSVDQVPNCIVNGAYSPVPPFPLFKIGQEKKKSNKLSIQEKKKSNKLPRECKFFFHNSIIITMGERGFESWTSFLAQRICNFFSHESSIDFGIR